MVPVPPARHLLRARDLADRRYAEPLDVPELARAARLSPAHFSREFARAFGETPHRYLLTRRLERAAALLRTTDRSVADICMTVGLRSVGSFTTSFGRMYRALADGLPRELPAGVRSRAGAELRAAGVGSPVDGSPARLARLVVDLLEGGHLGQPALLHEGDVLGVLVVDVVGGAVGELHRQPVRRSRSSG